MKVLAIGDIHTKTRIIYAVAKLIDQYDKVVFVGDYGDDWNAPPARTIATWLTLKTFQDSYPEKVEVLTGNHDYIYAYRTPSKQSGYNSVTQVLIDSPEHKDLKEWLRALPVTVMLDGVTYSHAGITDMFKYEYTTEWLWQDYSPLWARPTDSRTFYVQEPQVFGHTPSETCREIDTNIWCIDTFSTYPDGTPVGDGTILEIKDGKTFTKIKLENTNDDNSTTGFTTGLSTESNNIN